MKKIFILAILPLLILSCGKSKEQEKKDIILEPQTTNISGGMNRCFSVISREYKAIEKQYGVDYVVTIEVQRTAEDFPFDLKGRELRGMSIHSQDDIICVGFKIEYLDAAGNVLDKEDNYDGDEAVALCKLGESETGTIQFTLRDNAKDAVAFRIVSEYEERAGWGDASPQTSSNTGVIYSSDDINSYDDVDDDNDDDDNDDDDDAW